MTKMLKRVIFALISISLLAGVAAPSVKAVVGDVGPWYDQSFKQWYTKVYDDSTPATEIFGERYTAAQVQWVLYGLQAHFLNQILPQEMYICGFTQDISQCTEGFWEMLQSEDITRERDLADNSSLLKFLFSADRPVSAVSSAHNMLGKLNIVPEANAQQSGFGFSALNPVMELWKASRNLAYVLFTVVLIVMAFMIMFRVTLPTRAVISVQYALPKIIFAMILVTFSYAIAGFVIDLMYVVIGLISMALTGISGISDNTSVVFNTMVNGPTIGPVGAGISTGIIGFMLRYFVMFVGAFFWIMVFGNGLIQTASTALFNANAAGGNIVLTFTLMFVIAIVLIVILLIMYFRIMFMLLKAYANVVLLVAVAPLQIVFGTLSGSFGFGSWLKNFVGNLAVFPITSFLFMLSYLFIYTAAGAINFLPTSPTHAATDFIQGVPVIGWSVQNAGAAWPPLLGIDDKGVALALWGASFVMITIIPKTAEVIKGFMSGRPFAYGSAVGEAVGPVSGPAGFVAGGVKKTAGDIGKGTVGQALQRSGIINNQGGLNIGTRTSASEPANPGQVRGNVN